MSEPPLVSSRWGGAGFYAPSMTDHALMDGFSRRKRLRIPDDILQSFKKEKDLKLEVAW